MGSIRFSWFKIPDRPQIDTNVSPAFESSILKMRTILDLEGKSYRIVKLTSGMNSFHKTHGTEGYTIDNANFKTSSGYHNGFECQKLIKSWNWHHKWISRPKYTIQHCGQNCWKRRFQNGHRLSHSMWGSHNSTQSFSKKSCLSKFLVWPL